MKTATALQTLHCFIPTDQSGAFLKVAAHAKNRLKGTNVGTDPNMGICSLTSSSLDRGYYTVVRRYEFYFQVVKTTFSRTNTASKLNIVFTRKQNSYLRSLICLLEILDCLPLKDSRSASMHSAVIQPAVLFKIFLIRLKLMPVWLKVHLWWPIILL